MPKLTILKASKETGSPSRQRLTQLAAEENRLPFFYTDDKGKYGIDTDHPAWSEYIQHARTRKIQSTPVENGGIAINKKKLLGTDKRITADAPSGNTQASLSRDKLPASSGPQYSQDEIANAIAEQEIQDARLKKIKADREEIKLKEDIGNVGTISEVRYIVSFFERCIADVYAVGKTISKEVKHLYVAGRDREAEEYYRLEAQRVIENSIKKMLDELEGRIETDD